MGLLTYSGIAAKVHAMESRLISKQQFREMAALEDVRSVADYLKQLPAYTDIFSGLDDTRLHRGYIEKLLMGSEYRDFARLYRFSNLSQRKFLDLCFLHYEITIIKQILHNVTSGRQQPMDLSDFQSFFDNHSSLDLVKLAQAENLAEFISRLEGSPYHGLMTGLDQDQEPTLFDYELRLDLFYFKTMWKTRDKLLTGKEQKIISQCFGSRLDLMNIQWIYRSKKYYQLPTADIYALLIPIRYHLNAGQIRQLVEAPSADEFLSVLKTTHYGRLPDTDWRDPPALETVCRQILNRIYANTGRRNPYTIAVLDSYLYAKSLERRKLIATIEGIRYGLSSDEIIAIAEKQ